MRLRHTRPEDLTVAAGLVPDAYRYSPAVRRALPDIWARLMREGRLGTGLVEDTARPPGERLRGVGLSVFVTDAFADHALAEPSPYLNARLHEMILAGDAPILTRREIAAANTGAGLTLLPLHYLMPSFDVTDPEVLRSLVAGSDLFRIVHGGYRIRRMFKEVVSRDLARFMIASGMRLHTDYGTGTADDPVDGEPYLLAAERDDMPIGSGLRMVLIDSEPRFLFSPAEQRVLTGALLSEGDEEIAGDLGLSPDTLRKHWRSIYGRVLFVDPLFFPDDGNGVGRGRGKRRHLLAYLRLHMEELRPHRKAANGARTALRAQGTVPNLSL